jgi:hypothetical protein
LNGIESVIVRDNTALDSKAPRFMRLRVTLP